MKIMKTAKKLIEKPELFSAFVYLQSPDVNAVRLRGKAFFDFMARTGYRVQQISGVRPDGSSEVKHEARLGIHKPWTFVFMPVGYTDMAPLFGSLEHHTCSFIMDCHFPIMDMARVITEDAEAYANVAGNREAMLANLRVADAVTCPNPDWAAELAEVNPNVYLLPDLDLPDFCYGPGGDLVDEHDADAIAEGLTYEGEDPAELLTAFAAKFAQIAAESAQTKQRRWQAAR